MALAYIDGFDHYNIADIDKKWTSVGTTGGATLLMDTGRVSGQSHKQVCNGVSKPLVKSFNTAATQGCLGFAVKLSAYTHHTSGQEPPSRAIASILSGGLHLFLLTLNADGSMNVTSRGGIYGYIFGGWVWGTFGAIPLNTWSYIEWIWSLNTGGNNGTMSVRVNGVEVWALTGMDYGTTFNAIGVLGGPDSVYDFAGSAWVDDVYVSTGDNNYLGDVYVQLRLVEDNGTVNDGTASTGDNHSCVDEVLADTSDYVTMDDVDQIEEYVVEDAAVGDYILGVQVTALMRKTEVGAAIIVGEVRHDGANHDHPSPIGITEDFRFHTFPYGLDPDGDAWTEANFNAAEFGIKKTW